MSPHKKSLPFRVRHMGVAMTVQKVQPYLCYNNAFIENLNCDNNGDIAQYAFYGCKYMKAATLCWIEVEPRTEGIDNAVAQISAQAMLIQTAGGQVCVTGLDDGRTVSVYGMSGMLHGTATSQNGTAIVETTLPAGSIVIVKTASKSVKCITR